MKIYIKVALAFFILLFGTVTLIELFSSKKNKPPFKLINEVQESDLVFHADLTQFFHDFEKYSKGNEMKFTDRLITGQVKQQLLKSGLKLKETYLTYSIYKQQTGSFYAEIEDTSLFEVAFERFSSYFDLENSDTYPLFYISQSVDLSIEKHPRYVKVNWGKHAKESIPNNENLLSEFSKKLLTSTNSGFINILGTPTLEISDYAIFTYEYDKDFELTMNWNVTESHPLQLNHKTIPVYPSQKNKVQAYSNINIEQIQEYNNPHLTQIGTGLFEKLPSAVKEMLRLWNGQASLQMGGKHAVESIQYVTEFDDDFNQIEKKISTIDSIPDLGFYWGTSLPKESFELLKRLPNVKVHNNHLQMALFPPLNIKQETLALKATSKDDDFNIEKSNYLVYINSENELVNGSFTIRKISNTSAQIKLILKNPSVPEKFNISSFW